MQRDGCANGGLLIEKDLEGGFLPVIHFNSVIAKRVETLERRKPDEAISLSCKGLLREACPELVEGNTLAMTVETELSCGS